MNSGIPFFVNPFFQGGNNMQNYPNVNSMQNVDIRNLENRVYNLEKEVASLKNKINRLENSNNNYNDNYSSSYKANSYNMM